MDTRWVYERATGKWMVGFRDPSQIHEEPARYGEATLAHLAQSHAPDPISERCQVLTETSRPATAAEVLESRREEAEATVERLLAGDLKLLHALALVVGDLHLLTPTQICTLLKEKYKTLIALWAILWLPVGVVAAPAWVDVTANGVKCDGATDDTSAFQTVLTNAASGAVIYVPRSATHCLLTATLSISNKSLKLLGDGPAQSTLTWTESATSQGIYFSTTDITHYFEASGLQLLTQKAGGGYAVGMTWPSASSYAGRTGRLSDLRIASFNSSADWWDYGLVIERAWNLVVEDVLINGETASDPAYGMDDGVRISNGMSVGTAIYRTTVFNAETGYRVLGAGSEATGLWGSSAVGVKWGLVIDTGDSKPQGPIVEFHADAEQYGIFARNAAQLHVSGGLYYKLSTSTLDFNALNIGGDDLRVTGAKVRGQGAGGAENGIVVYASNQCVIGHNAVADQTYAIWLQSGTAGCIAQGNTARNGTQTVLDQGTSNLVADNKP